MEYSIVVLESRDVSTRGYVVETSDLLGAGLADFHAALDHLDWEVSKPRGSRVRKEHETIFVQFSDVPSDFNLTLFSLWFSLSEAEERREAESLYSCRYDCAVCQLAVIGLMQC